MLRAVTRRWRGSVRRPGGAAIVVADAQKMKLVQCRRSGRLRAPGGRPTPSPAPDRDRKALAAMNFVIGMILLFLLADGDQAILTHGRRRGRRAPSAPRRGRARDDRRAAPLVAALGRIGLSGGARQHRGEFCRMASDAGEVGLRSAPRESAAEIRSRHGRPFGDDRNAARSRQWRDDRLGARRRSMLAGRWKPLSRLELGSSRRASRADDSDGVTLLEA